MPVATISLEEQLLKLNITAASFQKGTHSMLSNPILFEGDLTAKNILGNNKAQVMQELPFEEEINQDIIGTLMNC